mmetsp:Transcript_1120/g.3693  ORF Transcript_1120/g.3693 Transcript_1120/m.3693 type:complete len:289 (+) Transcript_1120:129-995(+)
MQASMAPLAPTALEHRTHTGPEAGPALYRWAHGLAVLLLALQQRRPLKRRKLQRPRRRQASRGSEPVDAPAQLCPQPCRCSLAARPMAPRGSSSSVEDLRWAARGPLWKPITARRCVRTLNSKRARSAPRRRLRTTTAWHKQLHRVDTASTWFLHLWTRRDCTKCAPLCSAPAELHSRPNRSRTRPSSRAWNGCMGQTEIATPRWGSGQRSSSLPAATARQCNMWEVVQAWAQSRTARQRVMIVPTFRSRSAVAHGRSPGTPAVSHRTRASGSRSLRRSRAATLPTWL